MWCVTVAVGNIPWALMFKTKEGAERTFHDLTNNSLMDYRADDDYGQTLIVKPHALSGVMCEDMDKSKLAHIERALHHARMQHEGQKLAQADATLRMGNAGPAILQPGFGNGGFPRQ